MTKKFFLLLIIVLLLGVWIPNSYAATYQTTVAANARSCAKVSCSVVTRLAKGATIEVSEIVEGDTYNGISQWLKISVNGRTAYVHASLAKLAVGALPPASASNNTSASGGSNNVSTVQATAIPTEAPVSQPPAQLTCGTCGTMASCDQARACLAAGNGDLDRDKDGVPCESICPGG